MGGFKCSLNDFDMVNMVIKVEYMLHACKYTKDVTGLHC